MINTIKPPEVVFMGSWTIKSRDEHGYVKGAFREVENKATRLQRDTIVVTRTKE